MSLRTLLSHSTALRRAHMAIQHLTFPGSSKYWELRYARGGNSGAGSYGAQAVFKAEILNEFVNQNDVGSVIEFGCGDGHQLSLAKYPAYLGVDVSAEAIRSCERKFMGDPRKQFMLLGQYHRERADLAISLDVIYHLIEDDVYQSHMAALFGAANRWVGIFSTDSDINPPGTAAHVRHRKFSAWVATNAVGWSRIATVRSQWSAAEFQFYVFSSHSVSQRESESGP